MSTTATRLNIEAQERVVIALWNLCEKQQTRPHDVSGVARDKSTPPVTVNLAAIGETLREIMEAFGYDVVSIQ